MTYHVDIKASNQIDYTVESATDYYPYGKALRSYGRERYMSTYHERDLESGFDYRGARFYDGDIVRFNSLDPLAAEYPGLSDYCYVAGNPLFFVDPTGKSFNPPTWSISDIQQIARLSPTVRNLEKSINISTWNIKTVTTSDLQGHLGATSSIKPEIMISSEQSLESATSTYIWELTNASNQALSKENTIKSIFGVNTREEHANEVIWIETEAVVNQHIAVKEINDSGRHSLELQTTVPIDKQDFQLFSNKQCTKEDLRRQVFEVAKNKYKNMFETYQKQYDNLRKIGQDNNLNPDNYEDKKDKVKI